MKEKMRYILRLLIVIMLNIFVIALLGHVYSTSTESKATQVLSRTGAASADDPLNDANCRLLAELITAEAADLSYLTQVAVGAVALNRMEHPSFPDTLTGVAYQFGAFAAFGADTAIAESAFRAAKEALNGVDPTGGALYYYNTAALDEDAFSDKDIHLTIGALAFCSN